MKTRNRIKRILAGIMAATMAMSLIPTLSYAAQFWSFRKEINIPKP